MVRDVDAGARIMLEHLMESLSQGKRIEIRGFGRFTLEHVPAKMARNPMNGETVNVLSKYKTHFKPGKELR